MGEGSRCPEKVRALAKFRRGESAVVCRACAVSLLGLLLAGCGLAPRRPPGLSYVLQRPAEAYPEIARPTTASIAAALGPPQVDSEPRTKPMNILAVCAGGMDSSFTAGAVVGWTKAGNRPTFDVVTGTSSGALVGAFAFLGPKYDDRMQAVFTELITTDLFRLRPVRNLLRDGALASPDPLERLIAAEITEEFMTDLRDAHAQGRRLFVGTTHVENKRLVVWDLGAIASSGRPDADVLVCKILLASVTWPGLLPPVDFLVEVDGKWRHEHHIDGGATAQVFVRFGPMAAWPTGDEPASGWMAGSNLFVLACGRLYEVPAPAPPKLLGRILGGVSCITGSLARGDMHRLYALSLASGMRFHLLSLPADYRGLDQNLLKVDRAEMRRLFDTGYKMTAARPTWRHTAPGIEPGEEEAPRGVVIQVKH